MKVTLESVGNPDFGQNPSESLYGCDPNATVEVSSFEHASALCRQFIDKNELGGGNWSGGLITEGGKEIAYVSYNGRVWKIEEGKPRYSGDNEEISIDKEKMESLKTILTLVKRTPIGNNSEYHYKDEQGRKFVFESTSDEYTYNLLGDTHKDFHSQFVFEMVVDKFIMQGIRQRQYEGGFDEAISKLEFFI